MRTARLLFNSLIRLEWRSSQGGGTPQVTLFQTPSAWMLKDNTHTHTRARRRRSLLSRELPHNARVSAESEETQIGGDNFKMTLSVLGRPARWNVSPCVSLPHVCAASGFGCNDVASSRRSCVTQYPSHGSRVPRLTFRFARCAALRAARAETSNRGETDTEPPRLHCDYSAAAICRTVASTYL